MISLFYKVFGLSLKIIFLIIIAPMLPDGVFSSYLVQVTYAMILSKVLGGGVEEQYPIDIKGSVSKFSQLVPNFIVINLMFAFFALIVLMYSDKSNVWVLLAVVYTFSYNVSGAVRTIVPSLFDFLINLPWLIFISFNLLKIPASSVELITYLILSQFISSLVTLIYVFIKEKLSLPLRFNISKAGKNYLLNYHRALKKCCSNLGLFVLIRSPILVIEWIYKELNDSIAITYSIAESIWQLSMVIVNKRYAVYLKSRGKESLPHLMISVLLSLIALCGLFIINFSVNKGFISLNISIINLIDLNLILLSCLYLISVMLLIDIRYSMWAIGKSALKWDFLIALNIVLMAVLSNFTSFYFVILAGFSFNLLSYCLLIRKKDALYGSSF